MAANNKKSTLGWFFSDLFKRKAAAKNKVVKPTSAEQKIIDKRLRKRYPQMYGLKTTRTAAIEERLSKAGISSKTIKKLRGVKK